VQVTPATWKVWIFSAVFLPITVSLGFWQLDRAEDKQARKSHIEKVRELPPVQLSAQTEIDPQSSRSYLLKGTYQSDYSFLLDNRTMDGKVGYEVLTLFASEWGSFLINRGWIQAPPYRDRLPEISAPSGLIQIQGRFHAAENETPVLNETSWESNAWPKRIQKVEWSKVESILPSPLSATRQFRLDNDKQPGAFVVNWSHSSLGPEKHRAYAVQWFSMTVALLVLTVLATFKLQKNNKD